MVNPVPWICSIHADVDGKLKILAVPPANSTSLLTSFTKRRSPFSAI
ncbi:hypothetical protein [Richelia sinica]|nr:hypothetical protein [Richelia sinica]